MFDTRSPSPCPGFPAKALLTNQGGKKDAKTWLSPKSRFLDKQTLNVSAVLNQTFWSKMLCKGSSLLVMGVLQWLQWHTQTPRRHPDFCPLLLLVLLVSWKQEESMMSFSPAVMFFSKFVALASLSLRGTSSTCSLRSNRPAQCCDPQIFEWWWGHLPAQSKQWKPPCCSICSEPEKPFTLPLSAGKSL